MTKFRTVAWLIAAVLVAGLVMGIVKWRGADSPRGRALAPVAMCLSYVEAQKLYHQQDYDGDGVFEFARSLKGDNSLLEKTSGSGDLGLIDKTFAAAEGLPGAVTPKGGYVYKVLTAQGAHAPGGRKSYIDDQGNMTQGFALIACPGTYNGKGSESFTVNQDGDVYFKDLGPDTPAIMERMTEFDPDETWEKWN